MVLGMSTATFTLLHVLISLIAIVSGIVVTAGMWRARRLPGWTALFLITTIATSVTGFFFYPKSFGPPHVVGVLSLMILAAAPVALSPPPGVLTVLFVLAVNFVGDGLRDALDPHNTNDR